MRLKPWPIVLLAGMCLTAFAVIERDLLADLFGGHDDATERATYAIDDPTALGRARDLLVRRLHGQVTVGVEGDHLTLTGDPIGVIGAEDLIAHGLAAQPVIALHLVDYDPAWMKGLGSDQLHITAGIDELGRYVFVPSDGMYVNTEWAASHGCTGRRIEGTGVYCWVTAEERWTAFVHGDPLLFVEPAAIALPADRAWLADHSRKDGWRFYAVDAKPMELAYRETANVMTRGADVAIELSPRGGVLTIAYGNQPTDEVVTDIENRIVRVTRTHSPSGTVTLQLHLPDAAAAQQLADQFALAALAGHLHRVADP